MALSAFKRTGTISCAHRWNSLTASFLLSRTLNSTSRSSTAASGPLGTSSAVCYSSSSMSQQQQQSSVPHEQLVEAIKRIVPELSRK
jgi:hypothetical protein